MLSFLLISPVRILSIDVCKFLFRWRIKLHSDLFTPSLINCAALTRFTQFDLDRTKWAQLKFLRDGKLCNATSKVFKTHCLCCLERKIAYWRLHYYFQNCSLCATYFEAYNNSIHGPSMYFVSSAIPISYSTTSNENFSTLDYLEINEVNENFSILECNSNVLSDRFAINCFYCLWKEYWKNLFTANLSFQLLYVSNHLLIIVNTILIKLT